jgi:hypothetical protein
MLFEGATWTVAFREFRKVKGDLGYWAAIHASEDPPTFTVLFEDSAALLGLSVACLCIARGHELNMPMLDGVASIVIGTILAAVAILLVIWIFLQSSSCFNRPDCVVSTMMYPCLTTSNTKTQVDRSRIAMLVRSAFVVCSH